MMSPKKDKAKKEKSEKIFSKQKKIDKMYHIDWIGEYPDMPEEEINFDSKKSDNKKQSLQNEEK